MKNIQSTTLRGLACIGLALATCSSILLADSGSIIPMPQNLEIAQGRGFQLNKNSTISYKGAKAKAAAELLASALRPATGYAFPVKEATAPSANSIFLDLSEKIDGIDGYALKVDGEGAHLRAADNGGLIRGLRGLSLASTPNCTRRSWLDS